MVQGLTDVHLQPPLDLEWIPGGGGGNVRYLMILLVVAFGILLIASVNYINLTTARALSNNKEISIRKAIGASYGQLYSQHFVDSIGISAIAMLLSVPLAVALIPALNLFTGKEISPGYLAQLPVISGIVGVVIVAGLLAGIYPAYFITRYNSAEGLQGKGGTGQQKSHFRNVLVVLQYAISATLLIFAVHVYLQLNYMQKKDLGFNHQELLVIDRADQLGDQQQTFVSALKANSLIVDAAISRTFPGRRWGTYKTNFFESQAALLESESGHSAETYSMDVYLAGPGLLSTLNTQILAGREFIDGHAPDTAAVLVNQKAVEAFGWEDPVGKRLYRRETISVIDEKTNRRTKTFIKEFEIIGVYQDFNYLSLEQVVEPLVIAPQLDDTALLCILVRIAPNSIDSALAELKNTWADFLPLSPFMFFVVEQELESLYSNHTQFGSMVTFFTFLSLIIATIGMFSLASYAAAKRKREIGIRKVLGASRLDIVSLLTKNATVLVGIACLIGIPLGYLFTKSWLDQFTYRVDIGFMIMLMAVFFAISIALITTYFQAARAARVNPIEFLRHE